MEVIQEKDGYTLSRLYDRAYLAGYTAKAEGKDLPEGLLSPEIPRRSPLPATLESEVVGYRPIASLNAGKPNGGWPCRIRVFKTHREIIYGPDRRS